MRGALGMSNVVACTLFGGQSLNTASAESLVVFTNTTASAVMIMDVKLPPGFVLSTDTCRGAGGAPLALGPGAACSLGVRFRPPGDGPWGGFVSLVYQSGGPALVPIDGAGERSLVSHYYRSVLGRDPDAGGKAFWDAAAVRIATLNGNINEVWYSMALDFFFSAEYRGLAKPDAAFVADLYRTFFDRAADAGGASFWLGQLAGGLPREGAVAAFLCSMSSGGALSFARAPLAWPVSRACRRGWGAARLIALVPPAKKNGAGLTCPTRRTRVT